MLLAKRRFLSALKVDLRLSRTGVMHAAIAADVPHALLSMLLAVHCRLAALDIEARWSCAEVIAGED